MSDGRFAGVDRASEEHAVRVVDERGRILEGRRYRHNEPGIRALCGRLVGLRVALVALERPDGLLIERLLDAGLDLMRNSPSDPGADRLLVQLQHGGHLGDRQEFIGARAHVPLTLGSCRDPRDPLEVRSRR